MKYISIFILVLLSLLPPSLAYAQSHTTRLRIPASGATVQLEKNNGQLSFII